MQFIKILRNVVFYLAATILTTLMFSRIALATAGQAARANVDSSSMPLALKVAGAQILNSKNEPVRLRGVNCACLEWTSDGQGHIVETVRVAIDDWKVNHIRLPMSQDRWFGKAPEQNDDGRAYRALVDEIVQLCASKGVYIILDLHWSNTGQWGEQIGQHSMPDEHSLAFWKDLAPVYANHPAVLYDLYNEPHDVTWDIWLNGGEVTDRPNQRGQTPKTFKAVGMQQLLDAVRAAGAKNVIVAGGLDWAYDFSGILEGRQLKDPDGNGIIYANHCYNNKNQAVETWIANMEKAAKKFPIIISEFGGAYFPPGTENQRQGRRRGFGGFGRNDGDWLMRVLQAIKDHHWSYTAWDFHPAAGPTLISDWNYTPSPYYGVYLKQMLAGVLPRYTPPTKEDPNSTSKLTDPLATPETKALYRNLHKLAREGILFGHQDTLAYGVGWKSDANSFDSDVYRLCGKFPAVFGWDIGHIGDEANIDGVPFENMKIWIVRGYEKGGINTISWHARIPGSKKNSWTKENVVSRLLPNGDMHETYIAKLDQVAAFIADLKGPAGEPVPVILRPFHEHNGDWFWWGAGWCTPDEYKQLWHLTIDYLRKTKGLHNLITCYSPDRFKSRAEYLERYPGDDYIDIIGHDNYGAFRSVQTKDEARKALETVVSIAEQRNKIATFSETGVGQSADNAAWWTNVLLENVTSSDSTKKLAWVLVWRNEGKRQNYAAFPGAPTAENFKAFEADPFTVFLEDLPPMYK